MFQNHPACVSVLALHLIVRSNGYPAPADLPAAEVAFFEGRLAKDLVLIVSQALRVLGPDQDTVQIYAVPLLIPPQLSLTHLVQSSVGPVNLQTGRDQRTPGKLATAPCYAADTLVVTGPTSTESGFKQPVAEITFET